TRTPRRERNNEMALRLATCRRKCNMDSSCSLLFGLLGVLCGSNSFLLAAPIRARSPCTQSVGHSERRMMRQSCLSMVIVPIVALLGGPESNAGRAAGGRAARMAPGAAHSHMVTLPGPPGIVLEVGGLAVRPDGKLLACTRRGEVWLISNPNAADPAQITYKLFATGLHE